MNTIRSLTCVTLVPCVKDKTALSSYKDTALSCILEQMTSERIIL